MRDRDEIQVCLRQYIFSVIFGFFTNLSFSIDDPLRCLGQYFAVNKRLLATEYEDDVNDKIRLFEPKFRIVIAFEHNEEIK